ncbi:hypothetical protein GCM10011505_06700 [Tistrella bauzanensis]|uniref:Uncharacterized protein n=1 Tax=Tistrella bauzanensis TaxID=657419 RepID=A0ABQ1IAA6_9PROT|nr:hypothetical protein GCM10011505_06700 [Tistrella bauzanensis]
MWRRSTTINGGRPVNSASVSPSSSVDAVDTSGTTSAVLICGLSVGAIMRLLPVIPCLPAFSSGRPTSTQWLSGKGRARSTTDGMN